jgi:predicted metal-dependent hydrolase
MKGYREHALKRLGEKVARYAKLVGVKPSSVSVKTFSGRWGGCDTRGRLQFNWKIIVAPNQIVDYIGLAARCMNP